MADHEHSDLHMADHDCVNADGEHQCGGHGSPDGICHHEDGTSHACCQAGEAELVLDESLR